MFTANFLLSFVANVSEQFNYLWNKVQNKRCVNKRSTCSSGNIYKWWNFHTKLITLAYANVISLAKKSSPKNLLLLDRPRRQTNKNHKLGVLEKEFL